MVRRFYNFIIFCGLLGLLSACQAGGPGANGALENIGPGLLNPAGADGTTNPGGGGAGSDRGEIMPKADPGVIVTKPPEKADPFGFHGDGDQDGGRTPPPAPGPAPTPSDPTTKDLSGID